MPPAPRGRLAVRDPATAHGAPIRVFHPRPMALARLCCFPFAGGGASAFAPWVGLLPEWMELWGACLPGREARAAEAMPPTLMELACEMARGLEPVAARPLVLFGHSMGAILAYEVARIMASRGLGEPLALIVSGRGPPWVPQDGPWPDADSDEDFARQVQDRFGGIPAQVFHIPELLSLTVRTLRADVSLVAGHRGVALPRLSCPVLALGGRGDPSVRPMHLGAWREATAGPFSVRTFAGGHFYMRPDPRGLVQTLSAAIVALRAPADADSRRDQASPPAAFAGL